MGWGIVRVNVNRDSVAMGDDMESHAVTRDMFSGVKLSKAIARCAPKVGGLGWTWVVLVDGEVAAVWSKDHGTQLLVADRKLDEGSIDIFYRYFAQMDAMWVFEQLASGARANRYALERAYAPVGEAKRR